MEKSVLLISPDEGFGELLRQVLIEERELDVDLVTSGMSALATAQGKHYAMTILDCAATDVPYGELSTALRDWNPGMQLVLVPPSNDPDDPAIDHTHPDALLSKPFYLPDLLAVVTNLLNGELEEILDPDDPLGLEETPPSGMGDLSEPFPWLDDVNRAAQYLASLSLETSARAAFITRGEELWAYAGELGQPAANQLAETVGRQWGSQSGNDLARFVTLDSAEFMLYATGLADEMVLALIFDAKTPFSKVRTQSGQVAKALAAGLDDEAPAAETSAPMQADEERSQASQAAEVRAVSETEIDVEPAPEEAAQPIEPAGLPLDWLPKNLSDNGGLLEEVEQSLEPFSIPSDWTPTNKTAEGPRSYLEELLGEPIPSVSLPYERRVRVDAAVSGVNFLPEKPYYPSPEKMAETRPTRIPPEDPVPQFESESASYFDITYACMLIPRMPQHHLVSEIARQLEKWMFQICVSFDWRMEQLTIRPDYMQWMVKVHSATAPRFLMQIITRLTSQRIFEHYPHMASENPSEEFWAPGWLVVTSESFPSPEMVQEFVQKTRKRQGLA